MYRHGHHLTLPPGCRFTAVGMITLPFGHLAGYGAMFGRFDANDQSVAVPLVDRRHQVVQRYAREVLASLDDAGGRLLRRVAVTGHGNKPRNGLAMARDSQALAASDAIEQSGQVPSGVGGADPFHCGPRFSLDRDIGAVREGGKRRRPQKQPTSPCPSPP